MEKKLLAKVFFPEWEKNKPRPKVCFFQNGKIQTSGQGVFFPEWGKKTLGQGLFYPNFGTPLIKIFSPNINNRWTYYL